MELWNGLVEWNGIEFWNGIWNENFRFVRSKFLISYSTEIITSYDPVLLHVYCFTSLCVESQMC